MSSNRNNRRRYIVPARSSEYSSGDVFQREGAFTTVRFQSDDGFIIGTFSPHEGESIVCKGKVPGFVLGAPYKLKGTVVNDKNWGIQVNIESAVSVKPSTEDELVAFLGSGAITGIGPMTAKRICTTFGNDTIHVLEQTPERLIEVKGIGKKTLERMIKEIPKQLQYREVIGFFASFGISTTTINTLIKQYGEQARDIVEANPYVLCKVRGFAFSRADSIAMKMGIDKHDPNRIYAGVLATLRWMCEAGGHTVIPVDMLIDETMKKLSVTDEDEVRRALDKLKSDGRIIVDDLGAHLTYLYEAEENIKSCVDSAYHRKDPLIPRDEVDKLIQHSEEKAGFELTDQQRQAVYNAVDRKLSILAGTPGGGKAQPLYSLVLTAYGWKQMGETKVGDLIYTPRGTLATVTGVYDRGTREVWRVYTDDGRYADCCDEHLWDVRGEIADAITGGEQHDGWRTCELRDIVAAAGSTYQIDPGKLRIPAVSQIEWLISSTDGVNRCCDGKNDKLTSDKMDSYIASASEYGRQIGSGIADAIASSDGIDAGSVVARLPRIRSEMLHAHIEQRAAFLDSLADTIGYSDEPDGVGRRWTLAIACGATADTHRKWRTVGCSDGGGYGRYRRDVAANGRVVSSASTYGVDGSSILSDLLELVRGLGLTARVKIPVDKPDAIVFEVTPAPADSSVGIVAIEDTGETAPMRCIMIDDPDHLYVTDGYIATHNTTACRIVSSVLRDAGLSVCLVSPTGRAAKRLSESCGMPAYTMHRALSIQVKETNDADFFAEEETSTFVPKKQTEAVHAFKKADVVLADEASMMDTEMAAILFRACRRKHLVLIGDPNQLPAVGCGQVLGDLIESSYATGEDSILTTLTKVFRQAEGSPIIEAANLVQQGKSPCYVRGITFYDCQNEAVPKIMRTKVVPFIKKRQYDYTDYMIISPIKKTPCSGVNALNELLRPLLNPRYKQSEENDWKLQPGDFVSQKKNNYDVDIFNGDIGVVSEVSPHGDVTVNFADATDAVEFEPFEVSDNLMLAYASTVHRQQGSQASLVVVVCTSSQFALLNRNLLYTAITRAADDLILVGDAKAFAMAARNKKENARMTGLHGM